MNLLTPQAIVLGGNFAPMTEWLAPVIAAELATRVLGGNGAVPPVLLLAWAPRPRCAAPPRRSCAACSRIHARGRRTHLRVV